MPQGHLRLGKVGLHHLGVILIVVPHAVALFGQHFQRVGHLLAHVGQVYLRQGGELKILILGNLNALHDVLQWGQQGRELTRLRVGLDDDVLRIVPCFRLCRALYGRGVAGPGAALRGIGIEQERLVAQLQRNLGLADVVLRGSEAHGQCVGPCATSHTAHEVDQRRVGKVVGHGTVEVEAALSREASAADHRVAVELGFNEVLAYGHRHAVKAVGIGLHNLTILRLQVAVYIDLYALGGDVRACIVDVALHGEAGHVLEIDVVGREARRTDEHGAHGGRELMDAQLRGQLVVGAALLEGYTFYNIIALLVGHAVETQPLRHTGRRLRIDAHLGVVQLVDAVLTADVEGVALHVDALVERPVEYQAVLRAAKDAGVVGLNLVLGQGAVPQADVVDVAVEGLAHVRV